MSVKRRMDRLIERSTDEEIAARMDKALAEWVYLSSYGASRGKTDGVHISTVTATAFLAGAGVQEHWEALNPRPAPVTESAIEAVAEHLWKSDGADDSLEWSGQTPEVCEDYRQRARSVLSVAGHASVLTQDDLTRFKAAWESADALGMAGRRVEAGMVALGLTVEAP